MSKRSLAITDSSWADADISSIADVCSSVKDEAPPELEAVSSAALAISERAWTTIALLVACWRTCPRSL